MSDDLRDGHQHALDVEAHIDAALTEQQLGTLLDTVLARLGSRCIWRREVPMLVWTPGRLGQASRARIDRVIQLDGAPLLLGIELKSPPEQAARIGDYAAEAAGYAAGQIARTAAPIPPDWYDQPLHGVFLAFDTAHIRDDAFFREHLRAAQRLYGPFKVGFVNSTWLRRGELRLQLCADRLWTARGGFHQGLINHRHRVGSGRLVLVETLR